MEGEELIDGRYKDKFGYDTCIILEDIDNQCGIIDRTGDIIIPFGMIRSNESDLTYDGQTIEQIIEGSGWFGFSVKTSEGYTFYSFKMQ